MNVSIKDCPDEVYQLIKQKARESGSTINRKIVDLLSAEMIPQATGTEELLKEIRKTRNKLSMEITDGWLGRSPSNLRAVNKEEVKP